jgi:uncharacterized circularly permuted ATP-grasp superfamily protein
MSLIADGDANRVFDQLQQENARREREQNDKRQAAEIKLLDAEGLTYREYRARRAAMDEMIFEPDLSLDDMTQRDFKVARRKGFERRIDAVYQQPVYGDEEFS